MGVRFTAEQYASAMGLGYVKTVRNWAERGDLPDGATAVGDPHGDLVIDVDLALHMPVLGLPQHTSRPKPDRRS